MKKVCLLIAFIILFILPYGCSSQQHKPIFKLDKSGNYTGFLNLPTDYTPEEALEDGCFVVVEDSETDRTKLYGGKEHWKAFLKASTKGEDVALRVVSFLSEGIFYDDLFYCNGYYHHFYHDRNSLSDNSPDTPYLYLRELTGKLGIQSKDYTIYVLTNSLELTYKDVIGTFASSSMEVIRKRDFDWLYFTGITGDMSSTFAPGIQNQLAKKLHLDEENTSIINKSISNNGITMTVVSSHVAKNTAVVMLAFSKDSKEPFGNCLNPDIEKLTIGNKIIENNMLLSELSEDKKTLYCYLTWHMEEPIDGKEVVLNVEQLICNESQVAGKTFSDEIINGKWPMDFILEANADNTITGINSNLSNRVSMCGKELQINSVVIADLQVIVNTTTISDRGTPQDLLSNVSTQSGMYYGVYVTVVYEDGSQSEKMDCSLDAHNNIIAYSLNTLTDKKIKEVHVKDIVILVSKR